MVNNPLIRPYFLGGVALGGVARIPMISQSFSFRGFQFDVLKSPTPGATHNSRPRSNPRSFSARVGRLALSNDGRSKNVPCIDEANEGVE